MAKIVIVDSNILYCHQLDKFLKKNGHESHFFITDKAGFEYLDKNPADIIFYDADFPGLEVKVILRRIHNVCPSADIIITASHANVRAAVEFIRNGALDYIIKPFLTDELLGLLARVSEKNNINKQLPFSAEAEAMSAEPKAVAVGALSRGQKKYIVGISKEARNLEKQIKLVASTNYSVIIYGESGTGKESVAYSIHMCSQRRNQPFIAIDCGVLTKELAGSELFGHEKGAFTGALNSKMGQFELADKGTIFLDEITNLPYDIQVSLLRVIQERKIRRLGSSREIEVDIRILVASNKKIFEASGRGEFREDLYHRFNEFSIDLPPLRERKDDIPVFAAFFLENCNRELGKEISGFSEEVKSVFLAYTWPGNLREMSNIIKRAALLCTSGVITPAFLPREMLFQSAAPISDSEKEMPVEMIKEAKPDLKMAALKAEYEKIVEVLRKVNYNKSTAALLLNIDRKTIYNKMRAYQMADQ